MEIYGIEVMKCKEFVFFVPMCIAVAWLLLLLMYIVLW